MAAPRHGRHEVSRSVVRQTLCRSFSRGGQEPVTWLTSLDPGKSSSQTKGPASLIESKEEAIKLGSDCTLGICLHEGRMKGLLVSIGPQAKESHPGGVQNSEGI